MPMTTLGAMVDERKSRSGRADDSAVTQPEVSVRRLVFRFVLAGLPALLIAILITALMSVRIGTRLGIDDAKRVTFVSAALIQERGIDDALLTGETAAIADIDDTVRRFVRRGSVVRVKMWAADGTIVYSDEPRLIGLRYELDTDAQRALTDNEVHAEVSDLDSPENRFETESRLLEVYQAVRTEGGTPLLFEVYFRYDAVRDTGRDLWARFAPIAVGALLMLQLVQIPFAVSLARRIRTAQQQRERLLQHALDSSDVERRRIASDLHDGPVQDLTGVSMSLAAAARSNPESSTATTLTDAGLRIRETVKSLRSMLVDIYPPNLHEEGLQSALVDLVGGLHNRGVTTTLEVDEGCRRLPHEQISLLYRAAQEAIRNVAAHAHASAVTVRVDVDPTVTTLRVEDDGVGFDSAEFDDRTRRGHVGLRSLAGLVDDAGGTISIRSEPDHGTVVRVSVPR
jgi:two-component system, NarL family, sensor kinase